MRRGRFSVALVVAVGVAIGLVWGWPSALVYTLVVTFAFTFATALGADVPSWSSLLRGGGRTSHWRHLGMRH